jgi:hypothetical protein
VTEEEHRMKYKEDRNSETVPMDTDILDILIVDSSGISSRLGTPFRTNDAPNLRKFVYKKS